MLVGTVRSFFTNITPPPPSHRGQKIQTNVQRMMKIWKDRRVYTAEFIEQMAIILEPIKPQTVAQDAKPTEFKVSLSVAQHSFLIPPYLCSKLSLLEDALTELGKFEAELKVKSSHLANLRVDIDHPAASLESLKGKHVQLIYPRQS